MANECYAMTYVCSPLVQRVGVSLLHGRGGGEAEGGGVRGASAGGRPVEGKE